MIPSIESLVQFKTLISGDKVIVINFWATWCGPCKVSSPYFQNLAVTFPSLGFYKVDVDALQDVAAEVGIQAMPTFFFFKNGQKIDSVVGADTNKLLTTLAKYGKA